jgi:endonuclease III
MPVTMQVRITRWGAMGETAAMDYTPRMRPRENLRERAEAVYDILCPLWPEAKPLLEYHSAFELVCAVALSAQCTDEQVNKATPGLFSRWPTSAALAGANIDEVEAAIRSLGFFRTKARHLVEAAKIIEARFEGAVPSTMEGLLELPGVGRKTANLVLSACFEQPGIIVDTHVLRACLRLGLGEKANATAMEKRIAELVPRDRWTRFSHAVNRHGKFVCTARKPACVPGANRGLCPLLSICPRLGIN